MMEQQNMPFDAASLNIRQSVFDMQVMTLDNEYPGYMPDELKPFHYCFAREGHVIMIIPRNYVEKALEESLDDYEIQIPVRYVLEKGYKFLEQNPHYIVGNFDYDDELQRVDVPTEYYVD